jgi:uncharacterized membrane protein
MANLSNIDNKFLVGTNGEVRIGDTATVANVKLRVKQTAQTWTAQFVNTDSSVAYGVSIDTSASSYGDAGTLQCYTNTGGGFKVQNDGKVGIGTTAPDAKLQVSGTSAVPSVSGTFQGSIFSVEGSSTVLLDMGTTGAPGYYTWIQAHDAGNGVNYDLALNPLGGNVGIGEDTPLSSLHVSGPAGNRFTEGLRVERSTVPAQFAMFNYNGGSLNIIATNTAGTGTSMKFQKSNDGSALIDQMVIDTNGNVGISTTPSDWGWYIDKAIQFKNGSYIAGRTDATPAINMGVNSYLTATGGNAWKYYGTGTATRYNQQSGVHNFYTAISGTIGNTITWQTSMTIDASSNVGIGTTSPSSYDAEADDLVIYNAVTPGITIALPQTTAAGSARGSILFADGTSGNEKYRGGVIYDHGTGMGGVADTMYLRAAVNSYLALNALGHVGIGTKQPAYKLQVSGVQNANDIVINNTTTGVNLRMSSIDAYAAVFTTGAKFLALGTNNSQHLWISDGGNVGVGTGTFDGNERQLKIAEMSSGVVGDIFDASKNPNAGRLIICGQNYSPMLSMRHYSASYGFDIWVDVVSTWDAYFDVRQQTSGFRWRGYTSNDGGEVPLMHLDRYGNLVIKAALTQNGSPSDRKLKENIKPIEKALDKVSKLKGVSFDWKESDSYSKVKEDYGFIAQDVKKIVPELVREDGGGMLSLQYNGITPIIIEAIKEQQKMIQELKAEIELLKNK